MEDFRLKVFAAVARNQSFTRAAAELSLSQPAVTKQIKNLEDLLGARLFDRKGNTILTTPEGAVVLRYANEIFTLYQGIQFELGAMRDQLSGEFRLGASTTIAQYLISPVLASFHEKFPQIQLSLLNGNSEIIENSVLSKSISLGIVEGKRHHPGLKYVDFTSDELVLVTNSKSQFARKSQVNLSDLATMPLVLRERGSGTLEVLESALKEQNVKLSSLPVIMHLGSTESIKSFLENSNSVSFVSIRAIQKEIAYGELTILPINGFRIMRKFSFIHLLGQPDGVSTTFMRFAMRQYNKK
ncbi:transcriptional regulator [Spirosoma montaniterrae]|uniref:Transcriptional regulator n=2 Tax=Spirosoma montaniterrae TaxID=1178516 RepID=A0A1P9X480_9BACT|nr:transcriptional regulator [Spirosoma montaniterrae]